MSHKVYSIRLLGKINGEMNSGLDSSVFQIKAVIVGISPMIWRRFLLTGGTTIAQLHYILQIAFGWTDEYLHRFIIHAKSYGIHRIGGDWFSDDADSVTLSDLGFRVRERFLYEYNYFDNWQVQLWVEKITELEPEKIYPICIEGKRNGPIEDCGGAWAFQELRQEFSEASVVCRMAEILVNEEIMQRRGELRQLSYWLLLDRLDLPKLNQRLQQHPLSEDPAFREDIIFIDS